MQVIDCEIAFRPPTADLRFLPEGPYDLGDGRVSWVAIQHGGDATTGSLNVLDLNTGANENFVLPGRPGFAFPTSDDHRFVIGLERRLVIFDTRQGSCETLADSAVDGELIEGSVDGTIINDGEFFAEGLLFGCKDLEFAAAKAGMYLWRTSDRTLHCLNHDQICSNGKVITGGDGHYRVFDIDSPTKQVVEYSLDVAQAKLEKKRVVVDMTSGSVFPDGMIASPDGTQLIIAFYNPEDAEYGEARQYCVESGDLQRTWHIAKSPQVTCPQLVAIDGFWKLFLTTAVEHMSPERQVQHTAAGTLFIGETGWAVDADAVSPRLQF